MYTPSFQRLPPTLLDLLLFGKICAIVLIKRGYRCLII